MTRCALGVTALHLAAIHGHADCVRELLHATARRLCRVLVEQRDFAEILDRYDSVRTFFYLDPPYVAFQPNGRYEPLSTERRRELFAASDGRTAE